ncbi:GDP-mannose 4,6-dehydratase [Velocimicrobium porci]|uniref:NAD-dependent epimerase/dehydratase family protein n=1 Tax=Velocimicrobium porci TaxID=2606634 RepID=A0A6L5Y0K1_9FIRM|nr:GDP-mannose 4,6-dehydratase [Velocimicrobium porci]MSS64512.1 NAD-dependent epimerase/dehydratase family protein [Velocimicrobium porci]
MKKALIIGAGGFVGNYLIDHLQQDCKWSIVATKLKHEIINRTDIKIYDLNILEKDSIIDLLKSEKPDYIFHLAAQSSVAVSWKNPSLTIDINIKGSVNVLDAIREIQDYQPRILLIGSGEEYGHILPEETPIKETNTLRPGNIYAATKACQNMIGKIYADGYGMDIMMVRAFNHIGPNQTPQFVVADFCKQVAEIEKGLKPPIIYVGNLSAKRDFTDVRDVVKAYSLIIEKGIRGKTYNVGSGKAIAISEILDKILALSKTEIEVKTDENKLRPVDVPVIEADISEITNSINWHPIVSLDTTLIETLQFWRKNVK